MRKEFSLFLPLALLLFFGGLEVSAQNKSVITVRGSELNSGVLILDIVKAEKPYRLQCNSGAPLCTTLKNGNYVLFELPENFGMYDCKCVDVYPESTVDPQKEKEKKLGEYCLIEK